jgi:hypothetical protein
MIAKGLNAHRLTLFQLGQRLVGIPQKQQLAVVIGLFGFHLNNHFMKQHPVLIARGIGNGHKIRLGLPAQSLAHVPQIGVVFQPGQTGHAPEKVTDAHAQRGGNQTANALTEQQKHNRAAQTQGSHPKAQQNARPQGLFAVLNIFLAVQLLHEQFPPSNRAHTAPILSIYHNGFGF